jgi:Protein of unknown function (DUF3667)
MTVDLEQAGALATATLVAKEIEGDAGKPHAAHADAHCANCNALLTGAYCHQCGQAAHVHRSLLHILEEGIHGVLHFDTKSWRTLPLLIGRPGVLTRRYIDGQRVRYVSPLALFLFSVFLMFFVLSLVGDNEAPVNTAGGVEEARKELAQEVADGRELVARRTAELAQAKTPDEKEDAADELVDAQEDLKGSEIALAALNATPTKNANGEPISPRDASRTATNAALDKVHLQTTHPKLARTIRHAVENPELTLYKLKNSAYKFAFMLVPLSLPFLWLMFFWRKGVTMYDHAIFTLYSLSFMSLWSALIGLLSTNRFTDDLVTAAVLIMPIHMFAHLKETYRLGWFSTWWRSIALLIAGALILALFLLLILFISLN